MMPLAFLSFPLAILLVMFKPSAGGALFDHSIQYDGCDGSALTSALQFECSYTVTPSVPENSRFLLLTEGCDTDPDLMPTDVTTVTVTETTSTTMSVVVQLDASVANSGIDRIVCLEYSIGTGGMYYKVDKRNIIIKFNLNGSFNIQQAITEAIRGRGNTLSTRR